MNKRIYKKSAEAIYYNPYKLLNIAFTHTINLFDIISDMSLAWILYKNSREDQSDDDTSFNHDYNIAFTWTVLSTAGPYVIMYSSMMNAYFNKDSFKNEKFDSFYFIKRVYLTLCFTAFGLLFMLMIDILQKIEIVIKLFTTCCKCKHKGDKSYRWIINSWIQEVFDKVFNLNSFELESFDK